MAPELFCVTLTGLPTGSAALTEVKKSETVVPDNVTTTVTGVDVPAIEYLKLKVLPDTKGPGEVVVPVMIVGPDANLSKI